MLQFAKCFLTVIAAIFEPCIHTQTVLGIAEEGEEGILELVILFMSSSLYSMDGIESGTSILYPAFIWVAMVISKYT